ncbi:CBS domain-containing protein [Litchfieldella rifensis]|uniref:CBS domain-containing protein n=1 Tax=Litchfieldella rifensis TaxID=762643 RepID=A0ABV7LUZ4_9GAMM
MSAEPSAWRSDMVSLTNGGFVMQVREVMTPRSQASYLDMDASIREVAEKMQQDGSGFEPLVQGDKIAGTVTDRDIAVRAVAEGKSPDDKVSSIATTSVLYTFEDKDVKDVLQNMREQKVQRLVVLNNASDKDFTGILSLGDIANRCEDDEAAKGIVGCCKHYH